MAQKKYTNSIAAKEAKRRQEAMKRREVLSDNIEYTGVVSDLWRSMREVEDQPMCVDHTYPDKEILLMRIAEMAKEWFYFCCESVFWIQSWLESYSNQNRAKHCCSATANCTTI